MRAVSRIVLLGTIVTVLCAPAKAGEREPAKPAFCLAYPRGVLPTFEQAIAERPNDTSVVVAPDGKRVAINDPLGRVVSWKAQPGADPILFASGGVVQALTAHGGLFVRSAGALVRVDVATGRVTSTFSGMRLPLKVTAARVDGSGRSLVISRTSTSEGELSILDDCELSREKCPGRGFTPRGRRLAEGWSLVTAVMKKSLTNGRLVGNEVVAVEEEDNALTTENPDATNVGPVVVLGVEDGVEHRRWKSKYRYLRLSDGGVAQWNERAADVLVSDLSTGKELKRLTVQKKPGEQIRSVNATSGKLVVETVVGDTRGAPAVWRIYDANGGRLEATFSKPIGGVAIAPDGGAVVADDKGVCWYGRSP